MTSGGTREAAAGSVFVPQPGERVLEMPSGRFWFRSDGLAVAVHDERRVPASALEAVLRHMGARASDVRVPLIVVMPDVLFVDPPLRRLGAGGAEMMRYFASVALVVGGPVSQLLARLVATGARDRVPFLVTPDPSEALRWSLARRSA